MIDVNLERRFAECSELVDAWKLFLELVNRATKPPKTTNAQLEQQFLNAKARIAILHDSFMESLRHDKQVGANMLEIVNRAITLRVLSKLSEPEAKKMEQEWHEVFMLLNGTVSDLNEERAQMATVNEFNHNLGKAREKIVVQIKTFFSSIYFKIVAVLAVIAFAVWGGPALGLYKWDSLRKYPALRPVVKTYLDITRNKMGFKMAYYDLQSALPPLKDALVPGVSAEDRTDKNPKESVIPQMLAGMKLYGPDGKELEDEKTILLGANGYDYIRFIADGNASDANAAVLWFEKTEEANRFMNYYRQYSSQMPDTYNVFQKVNVIIIVYSTNKKFLDDVHFKRIDLLKP